MQCESKTQTQLNLAGWEVLPPRNPNVLPRVETGSSGGGHVSLFHKLKPKPDKGTPLPPVRREGKVCGVYCWTHIPDGRQYVGSSVDCWHRKRHHQSAARNGYGSSFNAQMAKLGPDTFTFEIIEECAEDVLREREKFHIAARNCVMPLGFNVMKDPTLGWNYTWTDDMREAKSAQEKMRQSNPAVRAKASAASKRAATPEARAANSEAQRKRYASPAARAIVSQASKAGWACPVKRAAAAQRGRMRMASLEARLAQSARAKRLWSDKEYHSKQAGRMKTYWASPEARAAQSVLKKKQHAILRAETNA